jgi:hypothetical protein
MNAWQCPECGHEGNTTARKCSECYYSRPPVNEHDLDDQVTLLLREAPDRKVRTVARSESPLADALFDIAAGHRQYWDKVSWDALLKRVDSCTLTVEDWIREKEDLRS